MKFTQAKINAFRPPPGKREHEEIDDAMPGFGARWRANGASSYGEGVYFVKFKIGRKHGRLSLGKVSKVTLADAQADARTHFAMVARKVNPSTERAKAVVKVNDTIADHINGFRNYLRDEKVRSASHIHEVERSLRRYFVALHRFNPVDVDRAMVTKELSRIRTENGPIAADRSRSHLSTFSAYPETSSARSILRAIRRAP
jgi:Arm DNA-binding domain